MSEQLHTDILIVGAGLAGLLLAIKLAPRRCLVLSTTPLGEQTSSAWAQGGLAVAMAPGDSPADHAADTIAAGAGLTNPVVAGIIAEEARERVFELISLGVPFDRLPDGRLALSREAAHSHARVARVGGDLAGKAIMNALAGTVRKHGHITLLEGVHVGALTRTGTGRVAGAQFSTAHKGLGTVTARHVVLASGGIGGLFRVTTNPGQTRGDAIALAFRAGAWIADSEFVQFHPTAIDIGCAPAPLATEALRGEGAVLRNRTGRAFMADYHPGADLAPRDAASRAVATEIAAGRGAFLDCRAAPGEKFPIAFPTVFGACMSAGVDPRRDLIPVAPAAHYHMGGVATDSFGATSVDGLSACGECASTGAHGANRLASNSLLEAIVLAHRVATRLKDDALPEPQTAQAMQAPDMPAHLINELRTRMTRDCGVVRNERGLGELLDWIVTTRFQIGDANALLAAELIVAPALARKESRGAHYRSDHPSARPPARRSFLRRGHDGSILIAKAEPTDGPPTTS